MYQLEIDYEMVGPEYQYFEELKQWVKIAFEAGALRVAVWQSDQNGNNQRVVETFMEGIQAGSVIKSCVCDYPDRSAMTKEQWEKADGHFNQAGGWCCPHYGNTCGHCHQYD